MANGSQNYGRLGHHDEQGVEVIEAKWLFDIDPDQIVVVVHPQSIIHSMGRISDGSVIGQMSPPDMRLPIQYALTYPQRVDSPSSKMDWDGPCNWTGNQQTWIATQLCNLDLKLPKKVERAGRS